MAAGADGPEPSADIDDAALTTPTTTTPPPQGNLVRVGSAAAVGAAVVALCLCICRRRRLLLRRRTSELQGAATRRRQAPGKILGGGRATSWHELGESVDEIALQPLQAVHVLPSSCSVREEEATFV